MDPQVQQIQWPFIESLCGLQGVTAEAELIDSHPGLGRPSLFLALLASLLIQLGPKGRSSLPPFPCPASQAACIGPFADHVLLWRRFV